MKTIQSINEKMNYFYRNVLLQKYKQLINTRKILIILSHWGTVNQMYSEIPSLEWKTGNKGW